MSPSTPLLHDHTIMVTGAGFDIGRALSLVLAKHGATVALLDKDGSALDQVYDEILTNGFPEPVIIDFDLATLDSQNGQLIASQLAEQFEGINALIHTANWAFGLTPLSHYETEHFEKAMHHLFTIPWHLTRLMLPVLDMQPNPKVLFTLHASGTTPKAYWGPYSAASAALHNTAQVWADELENRHFEFHCITPPDNIRSAIRLKHFPAEAQESLLSPGDPAILSPYLAALHKDLCDTQTTPPIQPLSVSS